MIGALDLAKQRFWQTPPAMTYGQYRAFTHSASCMCEPCAAVRAYQFEKWGGPLSSVLERVWKAVSANYTPPDMILCSDSFLRAFVGVLEAPWYKRAWWKLRYSRLVSRLTGEFD